MVAAPVFLLLVLGLVEYGRMVSVQKTLTEAAHEGARRASLAEATSGDVNLIVTEYLSAANITGATVTLDRANLQPRQPNDSVRVSVSVPFRAISWLPAPMFLGSADLTAHSTRRRADGV